MAAGGFEIVEEDEYEELGEFKIIQISKKKLMQRGMEKRYSQYQITTCLV